LKVLDLFAGLGGWSAAFTVRGHKVITVDIDQQFDVTYHANILNRNATFLSDGPFDFILASPPCEAFSTMRMGRNWNYDLTPKNGTAEMGLRLVIRTLEIIERFQPRFFIIENPRAMLRKFPMMQNYELRTVTYCRYGEERMKPTDLWGGFPRSLILREMCENGNPDHVAAPRGSGTGSQGMGSGSNWAFGKYKAEAAKVPYQLSWDVCIAAEMDKKINRELGNMSQEGENFP